MVIALQEKGLQGSHFSAWSDFRSDAISSRNTSKPAAHNKRWQARADDGQDRGPVNSEASRIPLYWHLQGRCHDFCDAGEPQHRIYHALDNYSARWTEPETGSGILTEDSSICKGLIVINCSRSWGLGGDLSAYNAGEPQHWVHNAMDNHPTWRAEERACNRQRHLDRG